MKANYHTHSHYCDGKEPPRAYVEYAIEHGFDTLGFSGHAPVPFENTFAIQAEEYDKYCAEIRQLQEEYAGRIKILLGLEMDYMPGLLDDFRPLAERGGLDYYIGSVHQVSDPSDPHNLWFIDGSKQENYDEGLQRVFGGDIRRAVRAFFHQTDMMIESQRPPIIGHFDKVVMHNRMRYFDPSEKWFHDLACETIALMKECGSICELNTRGLYKKRHTDFYPSKALVEELNSRNVPLLVGTDAHHPTDLDKFEGAYEFLEEIGYRNIVFEF